MKPRDCADVKSETHRDDLPHLRRREALGTGLCHVVITCVRRAVASRAREPNEEAVHLARRALKRARAVLRLGEAMEMSGARAARRRLARHARQLSPLRDASVVRKIATKRELDKALAPVAPAKTGVQWWVQWKRSLASEAPRLERLPWGTPAPHDLDRALAHFGDRLEKAARRAGESHDIRTAHEWRKAVIVLRELILVARPLLGSDTDALHAALHALARRLGKAMDWHLVRAAAREQNAEKWLIACAKKKRKRALKRARQCWSEIREVLVENGLA